MPHGGVEGTQVVAPQQNKNLGNENKQLSFKSHYNEKIPSCSLLLMVLILAKMPTKPKY